MYKGINTQIRAFLTNNGRFPDKHPDYRRAFLLNILLLTITIICLLNIVISSFTDHHQITALVNTASVLLSVAILVYFHRTDNLKTAINITVLLILLILLIFLHLTKNSAFAFYWMAIVPPVIYFLTGTKKARIIISLFFTYILCFILIQQSEWQPAEFTIGSIFNIFGASLALVLLIHYFEISRKESAEALIKANAVLEDNKNELRLILDTSAEGIYGIDMEGNCTFCNNNCLEYLGYKSEVELIGKNMHSLIHSKYKDGSPIPASECRILKAIECGMRVHSENEVFWRADNTCFDAECYSYPKFKDNKLTGAVITFIDITYKLKVQEQLNYLNSHDSLTGLLNRQYFEIELQKYDKEIYLPISIIYGDLNGLKLTNDIFGHTAGDEMIKKAADVLKAVSRKKDVVARIGGDEFVWLLPNTDSEAIERIIKRVRKKLSENESTPIKCKISLGTYTKLSRHESMSQALLNAENEMYRDKTAQAKNNETIMLNELISILRERSPREITHFENTSRLCKEMGVALGWSEADIKKISDAGYYHDIGKIVLDESLLKKSGRLTEEEKIEKQQHPVIGYRIMNLFGNTLDLAEAVYYHHERWDGSGYPKGLKGGEIPVQSRIIAIAEQFDHHIKSAKDLASGREEALAKIRKLAGVKFDPNLSEIFIHVVEDKNLL